MDNPRHYTTGVITGLLLGTAFGFTLAAALLRLWTH